MIAEDQQRDYEDMRHFQAKFMASDHALREVKHKVEEIISASEQLLAWQPICSIGSSGDKRQKRLRKALDDYAER